MLGATLKWLERTWITFSIPHVCWVALSWVYVQNLKWVEYLWTDDEARVRLGQAASEEIWGSLGSHKQAEFSASLPNLPFVRTRWYSASWLSWCNHIRRFKAGTLCWDSWAVWGSSSCHHWGHAAPSLEGSQSQVGKPRLVGTRSVNTSVTAGCSVSQALEYQCFCLSKKACCSQGGMRDWKIPSCSFSFLEKVALAFCNTWISVYLQK